MSRTFNSFYAASGMRRNAFLPFGFGDAADRRERVAIAAQRRVSPELLAVLRAQSAALPPSAAREANLNQLGEPGTVVVATGQQVGLFLGPLYTLYKAASAIAIARELQRETGVPCVPLFWLQTEDHDFAEIAPCPVPTDDGLLRLMLQDDEAHARKSLADRMLGAEVPALLEELEHSLLNLPSASEVVALLKANYRPLVSPGRAFAGVLASFFADDGLIVFDPRCREGAQLAKPVLRAALVNAPKLEEGLAERGRALKEAGFSEQIEPRTGSPLVFFHIDGEKGPRFRMTREGDLYRLAGHPETLSLEELLAILDREPLRFSTSALLRPILQDTLFPTAVYVGGPAEVSYFAQLGPLYDAFDMKLPLVAERAHLRLVPHRIGDLMQKLGLSAKDVEQPRDALIRRLAAPVADGTAPNAAWAAELEQRLDALAAQAPEIDPRLVRATERARRSIRHALEQLGRRHQHAVTERDDVLTSRVARLQSALYPEGHLQERFHSFPAYAARLGLADFRARIMGAIDPFHPAMRDISI